MKKHMLYLIIIFAVCLIAAPRVSAQDDKSAPEQKKFTVSEDFLNTWKKVGDMTKEIRSFKTEKAVTVAGVRGAEAEDEALKKLYFKGGIKYPNLLELKNAIEILEDFIKENPDDPNVAQSKYFIGQCHVQLGDIDKAVTAYTDIVENYPASEYAAMAQEGLKALNKQN